MNAKSKILSMLKEAELYRQQGLLEETLQQYRKVEKNIRSLENVKNKESLLEKVQGTIEAVEKELKAFLAEQDLPEVSEEARKVMRTMFSLDDPEVKGSSLLGEAIALAGFGQYNAAIEAFERLLDLEHLRMDSAKKMIAYGLEYKGEKEALHMLQKWESDNRFTMEDRNNLIKYMQEQAKAAKAGNHGGLDRLKEPESEVSASDVCDIAAIRLRLPKGPGEGEKTRLNVNFQHGIRLNVVAPRNKPEISEALQAGDTVREVGFSSPIGSYSGTVYVQLNRTIDFGPHKGDASINLKILTFS
ncbi:MAG: hypothetical protein R6T92_11965 [Desulfosalsimonadaceae bacterium]